VLSGSRQQSYVLAPLPNRQHEQRHARLQAPR
jgi:hypothetical protein